MLESLGLSLTKSNLKNSAKFQKDNPEFFSSPNAIKEKTEIMKNSSPIAEFTKTLD